MRRACVIAIAAGVLAGCDLFPQTGPMPIVCDDGVPPQVCEEWRGGRWRDAIAGQLRRSTIVRIEIQCVVCDPTVGEGEAWAVLADGTTAEVADLSWNFEPPLHGPPAPSGP